LAAGLELAVGFGAGFLFLRTGFFFTGGGIGVKSISTGLGRSADVLSPKDVSLSSLVSGW
jgi:hypothetical protein